MKLRMILGLVLAVSMSIFALGCGSDAATKAAGGDSRAQAASGDMADNAQQGNGHSSIVIYFSRSGNTEYVANTIAAAAKADIFRIEPADDKYQADYDTVVDIAKEEQAAKARPEYKGQAPDLSRYDVVYLGYPIWWSDLPMIMYTFMERNDLSGKVIAPFCTHEGSGLANTTDNIKSAVPDARIIDGLAIRGRRADKEAESIQSWAENVERTARK